MTKIPKADQALIVWQFFATGRSIPFSNIWFRNIINCIWWPVLTSLFNLEIIFWNWFLNRTLSSIFWFAFHSLILAHFRRSVKPTSFLSHFTWYQVRMKNKIEYMTTKIQIGRLLTRKWHLNLNQWYKEYFYRYNLLILIYQKILETKSRTLHHSHARFLETTSRKQPKPKTQAYRFGFCFQISLYMTSQG